MSHARWKTLQERKLAEGYTEPDDVTEARHEIRLSMALAKAVYDRQTELGLTQTDLAERAGLTQAEISRIEGSDTVPTLPLLAKLAEALDATLNIALDTDDTELTSPVITPTQPEYHTIGSTKLSTLGSHKKVSFHKLEKNCYAFQLHILCNHFMQNHPLVERTQNISYRFLNTNWRNNEGQCAQSFSAQAWHNPTASISNNPFLDSRMR